MAKFINTQRRDTINSLTEGLTKLIKNPYYLYNDKSASIVEYFNMNTTMTTLDEGSKLAYSNTGDDSPLRFNHIKDAYVLLPDNRISTLLELDDFGLESADITGEGYVLPNTFMPYPGDYFCYPYLGKNYLFKVLETSYDTLDNGVNFYKFSYKYDRYGYDNIKKLVIKEQRMIISNIGSNYKVILEDGDYDFIESLELITDKLKDYYNDIFFRNKVQTFIFSYNGNNFYDSYLIEFLIRNSILAGVDKYTYITHAIPVYPTFSIDYDKTMFRAIELKDINVYKLGFTSCAIYVNNPLSLLSSRPESYFSIDYRYGNLSSLGYPLTIIEPDLIQRIKNNQYYEKTEQLYRNIIIDYFNNKTPSRSLLTSIEYIDFVDSTILFYEIPYIIYIMEYYIREILQSEHTNKN